MADLVDLFLDCQHVDGCERETEEEADPAL
jgi:hypothetical protein